ncbi:hypothetical protein BpHYR1_028376 [Brachionus plicatilis]|uniref:Uncharacterized protein n=1 Tax=Brachionus plicatilis TaxID=10195 RepID=A0A3M7QPX4_BRAPC|nr:hypothetical protein BpHYR1_028376 [Brachionus plicatilis]
MSVLKNDKLIEMFERKINFSIKKFHKKIFKFERSIKRLKVECNLDMYASSYRLQKSERLLQLLEKDACSKNKNTLTSTSNDIEDTSEGYFTSDTFSPVENPGLKDNLFKTVVPLITFHQVSEPDRVDSKECKVTLIWSIFDTANKKFLTSENPIIQSIKLYEIYSSCTDSLDHEELHFKQLEKKEIEKSPDWEIIGTVDIFEPPVKCKLEKCMKNWIYYFTVRIKYRNNECSEFSNVKRISLI